VQFLINKYIGANHCGQISMKRRAKRARTSGSILRERLRKQGLTLRVRSVPNLRDPKVRADLRPQGKLLAKHLENDAIDAWIEAVYDCSDWR
jgi:hypothetical protein